MKIYHYYRTDEYGHFEEGYCISAENKEVALAKISELRLKKSDSAWYKNISKDTDENCIKEVDFEDNNIYEW